MDTPLLHLAPIPVKRTTIEAIPTSFLVYADLLPRPKKGPRQPRQSLILSQGEGFLILDHAEGMIVGFELILPRPLPDAPLSIEARPLLDPGVPMLDGVEEEREVRTAVWNGVSYTGSAQKETTIIRVMDLGDAAVGLDDQGRIAFVGIRTALLQAHQTGGEGRSEFHSPNDKTSHKIEP